MNIKNSWNQVTISEYLDYLEILDSPSYSDFEKKIRILCHFAGVNHDYFDDNTPSEINHLYKSLDFLSEEPKAELKKHYQIGKIKYKLINEVRNLTSGQFIDLENANKKPEDRLDNLHISCSAVLLPTKNLNPLLKTLNRLRLTSFPETEKYGETPLRETQNNILENMKISEAFSIGVFFCLLVQSFAVATKIYLDQEVKKQCQLALKNLSKMEQNIQVKKAKSQILSFKDGIGLFA